MKQYVKTITIPMYYRGVLVFIGSREQLKGYLDRHYPSYAPVVEAVEQTQAAAFTFKLDGDALIFTPQIPSSAEMVHEIFHAARHILDIIGVKLTDDTEEVFAYLMEYLSEQILPWLKTFSCGSQLS